MASTSNKNTPGNYKLETLADQWQNQYMLYPHSYSGSAFTTNLAGDGLIHGRMPNNKLSRNAEDIESFLFGIGSTNLVNPKPKLVANLNDYKSLAVFKKDAPLMPRPLTVENNQREYLN